MTDDGSAPDARRWEIGATVVAEHVVDEVQMFFFSAATNNGHRIHYDLPYATQVEGRDGLLVHGPLQAALAQRLVTDWIGPTGSLSRIECQHRANVHPGDSLRFEASITAVDARQRRIIAEMALRGVAASEREFLRGSAVVHIPV